MSTDWVAIQAALSAFVIAGSGLPASSVLWSQNKAPRPAAPGIVMRLSSVEDVGDTWVDVEDNPLVFDDLVVTGVSAAANTLTVPEHNLTNGDGPIRIESTLTLPGNLTADTDYWVIFVDVDTIQLAASFAATGGTYVDNAPSGNTVAAIDLSSAGSGSITITDTEDTLRAGEEILQIARGQARVILSLECHTVDSVGLDMAVAVLRRVAARAYLPSQTDLLDVANIGILDVERVRAVRGHLDALLFEPRATLDIVVALVSEEPETGTIIRTADITPTISGVTGIEERVPVGS